MFIAVWHILPDEQAELVRPVVPSVGFDLDVFSSHVKAELFRDLDVVFECVVGRRGVKAVRPPALVQRAEEEQGLVVEQQSCNAIIILAQRDFSHAEVAFDGIDLVSNDVVQCYFDVI